jgi:hypothetical protein
MDIPDVWRSDNVARRFCASLLGKNRCNDTLDIFPRPVAVEYGGLGCVLIRLIDTLQQLLVSPCDDCFIAYIVK